MERRMSLHAFVASVIFVVSTLSLAVQINRPASAEGFMETPSAVVPVANAPIQIKKCKLGQLYNQQFADVINRTNHSVLSVTMRFNYFDADGAQIGSVDSSLNIDPPLTGGDNQLLQSVVYPNLSESANAVARMTCRIQAATFTGLKKWAFGEHWREPLLPLAQRAQDTVDMRDGAGSKINVPTPHLVVAVTNAWNDVVNSNLIVHVSLDVSGGNQDLALRPQMLLLVMTLSNTQRKNYTAMSQSAPTYQKINPLGNATQVAYEVDPNDDLGHLGSVLIPAHGKVRVTASFMIGTDSVLNAGDNRGVALR